MTPPTRRKESTEEALRAELEAARAELRSAHEVQAAITHILELLNSSVTDAQPVMAGDRRSRAATLRRTVRRRLP